MNSLLTILMLFVGGVCAQNFAIPGTYVNCTKPKFWKSCVPFRTNADFDKQRWEIFKKGWKGGFGRYVNLCPDSDDNNQIKEKLFFSIYRNGQFVQSINGVELFANPLAHLPLETPIIFLMGGIMTDCGIPAEEIGQILEWRTSLLHGLNHNGVYSIAVIINWGQLSCQNYDCLVLRTVTPLGNLLGQLFRHFDENQLTIVGQSIAGHILAIACNSIIEFYQTTKVQVKKIAKFIGLDIAGPLVDKRRYLLYYKPKLDYMLTRDMATKTIIVVSNPKGYGSDISGRVGVEIHLNPHNNYKQVGAGIFLKSVHYHAFPSMLASGMGANALCPADDGTPVNVFYDHIPDRIYNLTITKCWPYCCPPIQIQTQQMQQMQQMQQTQQGQRV